MYSKIYIWWKWEVFRSFFAFRLFYFIQLYLTPVFSFCSSIVCAASHYAINVQSLWLLLVIHALLIQSKFALKRTEFTTTRLNEILFVVLKEQWKLTSKYLVSVCILFIYLSHSNISNNYKYIPTYIKYINMNRRKILYTSEYIKRITLKSLVCKESEM